MRKGESPQDRLPEFDTGGEHPNLYHAEKQDEGVFSRLMSSVKDKIQGIMNRKEDKAKQERQEFLQERGDAEVVVYEAIVGNVIELGAGQFNASIKNTPENRMVIENLYKVGTPKRLGSEGKHYIGGVEDFRKGKLEDEALLFFNIPESALMQIRETYLQRMSHEDQHDSVAKNIIARGKKVLEDDKQMKSLLAIRGKMFEANGISRLKNKEGQNILRIMGNDDILIQLGKQGINIQKKKTREGIFYELPFDALVDKGIFNQNDIVSFFSWEKRGGTKKPKEIPSEMMSQFSDYIQSGNIVVGRSALPGRYIKYKANVNGVAEFFKDFAEQPGVDFITEANGKISIKMDTRMKKSIPNLEDMLDKRDTTQALISKMAPKSQKALNEVSGNPFVVAIAFELAEELGAQRYTQLRKMKKSKAFLEMIQSSSIFNKNKSLCEGNAVALFKAVRIILVDQVFKSKKKRGAA